MTIGFEKSGILLPIEHEVIHTKNEILESFLFQFYADKEAPPKILVNCDKKNFKNVEKIKRNKSQNLRKSRTSQQKKTYVFKIS